MITGSNSMSRAWLIVALLWFVACLNYLDRIMITTMRDSVKEAIPMTEVQFGLLTSAFLWVYGVLSPVGGFLADRFSRSRVIIGSVFIWSVVTWMTSYAKTFDQLLLTRALMGASEACYIPAALALIADYHRGSTRSSATGLHMTGISAGSAFGGIGGWMAVRYGWNSAFLLFGMIGVVYATIIAFVLRDPKRDVDSASTAGEPTDKINFFAALTSLCSRFSFFLMALYWGLLGVAGWALIGWMPTYLREHFSLPQDKAGFYATLSLHIASPIGLMAGGYFADRWSRTNERGRILVPVIGLCCAAPGVLLVSQTGVLQLALLGLVVYGIMRAFTDANTMPVLCMVADPRYRATGYGLLNMFNCVIAGVTVYAGGVLRDAKVNVNNLFLFAAFGLVLCAILLVMVRPDPKAVAIEK